MEQNLPLPPRKMRELVGPTDESLFDNSTGGPVFSGVEPHQFAYVFDFGCGCGRLARRLIQQRPRPSKYLGVDLHRGMVKWCRENLTPYAPGFQFQHHDVHYQGFNPSSTQPLPEVLPFPVEDDQVTLFVAWSVFTHLVEKTAEYYLKELARVLHPDGVAMTTWFLFEKTDFPMMQGFQNALFINDLDPVNAVIFDRTWLKDRTASVGLVMDHITPPEVRGYQWEIRLGKSRPGRSHVDFPEDLAPRGTRPPPLTPVDPHKVGL